MKNPKECALELFSLGFTFEDFKKQWPNLANSEYGKELEEELKKLTEL